jgi:triphosphoribosyl-dephospho-CoA synthase
MMPSPANRNSAVAAALHQATIISLIASYADQALRTEVLLTPKPGLVDQRNSGAHDDMDLQIFLASARAIAPWWSRFVALGYTCAHMPPSEFLVVARPAGIECERDMFAATNGVNTHKGAIFSLGLLCCAGGRLLAKGIGLSREHLCSEVARMCDGLVDRELKATNANKTAGEHSFRSYRVAGARGEAASGFALVREVALPLYDQLESEGVHENLVLLQVLLHLFAINSDTNLLSRGGVAGLNYVREHAGALLQKGGVLAGDGLKKLEVFDDQLIARHLSPGGSADLLGVTWFLAQFSGYN